MKRQMSISKHLLSSFSITGVVAMVAVTILCLGTAQIAHAEAPRPVTIFAAASTTNAISDINGLFEGHGYGKAVASFASSSTLAKQIDNGAPADIYLSANIKWMNYLAQKGLIETDSRSDLLSNRIVLIASQDSAMNEISIAQGFPLADLLGGGRLSMGDPAHVPAGIYGKQALVSLGVWSAVALKIAPAKDVRSALVLVERGEAPLGLVYATDAAISSKVRVVGVFPETSHPAITYPAAIMKGHKNEVSVQYIQFLKSPEARKVFEKYGFSLR